jgi:hypothetical protein
MEGSLSEERTLQWNPELSLFKELSSALELWLQNSRILQVHLGQHINTPIGKVNMANPALNIFRRLQKK